MPHLPFLAIAFFPVGMLRQVGILLAGDAHGSLLFEAKVMVKKSFSVN
jgi:hypothetical protein